MKTTPKYLGLLGLAIFLTPSLQLQAQEKPDSPPQEANVTSSLDASFAAIADTIRTARDQASEAVSQRDKALSELAEVRKLQKETSNKLQETLNQKADTTKQLAEVRKDLEESKVSRDKFKKEAETLAKHLEVGDEAYKKLVALRSQMQESLKNLMGIDESIASFRAELAAPTSVGKLQGEIAGLMDNGKAMNKKLSDSQSALEKERLEREQLKKGVAEREHQLAAAVKRSSEIEKSRGEMNARVSELEKSQAETVTALKNAKEELAAARSTIEKNITEVKNLDNGQVAALAKANQRIEKLVEARKAAEQAAEASTAKLESVRKVEGDLKKALEGSEKKVGELEAKMKELSRNSSGSDENENTPKGDS